MWKKILKKLILKPEQKKKAKKYFYLQALGLTLIIIALILIAK